MKRLLTLNPLDTLAGVVLLVALVFLMLMGPFQSSRAQAATCWANGVSHTCSSSETAAWQAAAANAKANALAEAKRKQMIGVTFKVAQLPTCNAGYEGLRLNVTDATTPTWHGALTGGGAVHTPAVCLNSAWAAD